MPSPTGQRLFITRSALAHTQLGPDPDATRGLQPGQVRLAVEQFALTANNITYAAFGEAMQYWQFFPAPDATQGCLPVWGFASVAESRAEDVAVGRRVWGYFPAGTHLVVQVARADARGFVDAAPHRQKLAAVYNQLLFCDADPGWHPQLEGLQAVLRPLFMTSWLLDDFFADQQFFGARQLLLSSASSKTAFGTAFCLAARRRGGGPAVLGLTSAGNAAFARQLGCYDEVLLYDELQQLDPAVPTAFVDFAGNAALRRSVHEHFGPALVFSSSIGGTHWSALGPGRDLPGPRPMLFFAPAQARKRAEEWGRDALERRMGQAWAGFIEQVRGAEPPWVQIVTRRGMASAEQAYQTLLAGRADAREGRMFQPAG